MVETVGQRIRRLRKAKGWSINVLARESRLSPNYIWQIETGRRPRPSGNTLDQLARALGTSSDYLQTGITQDESGVLSIPIIGSIPCGQPGLVFEGRQGSLYVAEQGLSVAHSPNLYAVRVSGDSLIGDKVENGDYLIVDRDSPFIDGAIYIACANGDCCARHVYRKGDKALLCSSSGSQMAEIEAVEVELQGRVIASNRMQLF